MPLAAGLKPFLIVSSLSLTFSVNLAVAAPHSLQSVPESAPDPQSMPDAAPPIAPETAPDTAPESSPPPQSLPQTPADREVAFRLAAEFQRAASQLLGADDITVESLAAARQLALEAIRLDPDNLELLHWIIGVATLNDDDALRYQAVRRIVELDPSDEGANFELLNFAIDRLPTADDRANAYKTLLGKENESKLSVAARSRLAMDYALLERRRGNSAAFADLLSRSLEIDPANRDAAALAAGYFQINSKDPVGTADLLMNILLADPTDIGVQVELARIMLENGAYTGAAKIYLLASRGLDANRQDPDGNLLADLAISQWASGDNRAAMDTIEARQHTMDGIYRIYMRGQHPEMTTTEIMSAHAPLPVTLSIVRAAIHGELNDDEKTTSVNALGSDYDAAISNEGIRLQQRFSTLPPAEQQALLSEVKDSESQPDKPNRVKVAIAKVALEKAMMLLWLNGNLDDVQKTLDALKDKVQISDMAQARFDGWIAYRKGDLQTAEDRLRLAGLDDPAARLGLALICEDTGRTQEAARHFLAVARGEPGSVMAVWSAHRLTKILGKSVPVSDFAARLETLSNSIPDRVLRSATNSSLAIDIDVTPVKEYVNPFEPILVNIKLTNATSQPLWISDNGPIRRQIAILPTLRLSDLPQVSSLRPIIVDITRKLRLEPRESINLTVDVRRSEIGGVLKQVPLSSGIITVEVLSNFAVTREGVLLNGLYGGSEKIQFRIIGDTVNDDWLKSAIQDLSVVDSPQDIEKISAISSLLLMVNEPEERGKRGIADRAVPRVDPALIDQSKLAMVEAFRKMSPQWASLALLTVTSSDEVEELRTISRHSTDHYVLLAYVWSHLKDLQDPVLTGIFRGNDQADKIIAYGVAKRYEAQIRREQEAARRRAGTSNINSGNKQ